MKSQWHLGFKTFSLVSLHKMSIKKTIVLMKNLKDNNNNKTL